MEKQGNVVSRNPLARAGVSSSDVIETTNPIFVADEAQHRRFKAELGDADYKILIALMERGKNKDYEEFVASLTEKERSIFDRATKIRGGRRSRRSRRSMQKMLSTLYNKMTHTRKHRGGMEKIVPDYIVRKTEAHLAKLKKENEEWRKKLAEEKAEKARKHAEAMANPRRSTRVRKQKKNYDGGRRGTRRGTR